MSRRARAAATVAALAVALGACGPLASTGGDAGDGGAGAETERLDAFANRLVYARYGPADGAPAPTGGPLDAATFVAYMADHHREAIAASGELATRTADPELAAFAERVVRVQSAQLDELDRARTRLALAAAPSGYEPMICRVTTIRADELDDAFLRTMIEHHRQAVSLYSRLASSLDLDDEVGRLARRIAVGQQGEILLMDAWRARAAERAATPAG